MEIIKKSIWCSFNSPIGEPEISWPSNTPYHIERLVNEKGDVIWFGCAVNWMKENGKNWTVLTTNEDAKPLEKYLPEIVYGEDRTFWKECDIPVYEKQYMDVCELWYL